MPATRMNDAIATHATPTAPSAVKVDPGVAWYKRGVGSSVGVGVVIGLGVGAGGMYLVLRPPWGGELAGSADAGVVAAANPDGGVPTKGKKGKKRRPRDGGANPNANGNSFLIDDGEVEGEETDVPELTAADRRMEWRGDDTALPAQRIDMGTGGESRRLDDGEINSVISGQSGGVRTCVVSAASGAGDLSATITIKLVVDGNGKVTKSKLHAPRYLFEQGLQGCAQKALRGMRFAAVGLPTLVDFPVNLN